MMGLLASLALAFYAILGLGFVWLVLYLIFKRLKDIEKEKFEKRDY